MSIRYVLLAVFLGIVFVFAGVLAQGWMLWWLTPVHWLSRYQLFHLVAHFSIFAGVVMLYPQRGGAIQLWVIVLSGSIALELVQIAVGGFALTKPLLLDSLFDIAIGVMGAVVCWLMLLTRPLVPSAS
ncbi:MAG: hypothetical protein JXA10_13895 [Anaerolineae bacterium]|nr:hypothetical protein [Anaerolineae bacterium]